MIDKAVYRTALATPGLLIILVQHAIYLKLFICSLNLPWLTLPPLFVHKQDRIATKILYFDSNNLPETIEYYTGMPVVPVTNSMSDLWFLESRWDTNWAPNLGVEPHLQLKKGPLALATLAT